MKIAILLYDGFTMLDAVGPAEILSLLPDAELLVVAKQAGVIWPDNQAMPFVAPFGFADVGSVDILLVPGGTSSVAAESDAKTLDWIRKVDASTTWTCAVCTGSLILAAAGLLQGKPATTHWAARARLADLGAKPTSERWIEVGKYITAAGVSAGIDMALYLAAKLTDDRTAMAIQLGIEYDPQPPFASGAIATATPEIVAAIADGSIAMAERTSRPRPPITVR